MVLLYAYYAGKALSPLAPMLRTHKLNIFKNDWTHLLGQNLDTAYAVSTARNFSGTFNSIRVVPASEGEAKPETRHHLDLPPWRWDEGVFVRGWAWDRNAQRAPRLIFLVDDDDKIRGFAVPLDRRPKLAKTYGIPPDETIGWAGYVGYEHSCLLRAYALAADEKTVYPLPGLYNAEEHRLIPGWN